MSPNHTSSSSCEVGVPNDARSEALGSRLCNLLRRVRFAFTAIKETFGTLSKHRTLLADVCRALHDSDYKNFTSTLLCCQVRSIREESRANAFSWRLTGRHRSIDSEPPPCCRQDQTQSRKGPTSIDRSSALHQDHKHLDRRGWSCLFARMRKRQAHRNRLDVSMGLKSLSPKLKPKGVPPSRGPAVSRPRWSPCHTFNAGGNASSWVFGAGRYGGTCTHSLSLRTASMKLS